MSTRRDLQDDRDSSHLTDEEATFQKVSQQVYSGDRAPGLGMPSSLIVTL